MRLIPLAALSLLALSGCAGVHGNPRLQCDPHQIQCQREWALFNAHTEKARIMGNPVSDIACVRHAMRFGGANWTPTSFTSAASQCAYWQSDDPFGITNPRQLPLDLRDDPELQSMAEDPKINDAGPGKIWDYMRRDGTSTNGYYQ
ncbi:hypothetical protein [Gluconobacter japonicus]|uniref:hypothetical protein n=1 Tax=Gluconobacter japonicus TaxID=376620 RepID=UPI001B8D24A0|nr:hypothetical protein [Gluconobacter japonicus]MBS1050465.1 hypothetical protein [Gluconobacter japonicus]